MHNGFLEKLQVILAPENFRYIADQILNYTLFMINGYTHRICEIKFYLRSSQHCDLYPHGHEDQMKYGTY